MEKDNMKILYIIFFLNKLGQTILIKEIEKGEEFNFTNREEDMIKKEVSSYLISDGNDDAENEIERLFSIKKK